MISRVFTAIASLDKSTTKLCIFPIFHLLTQGLTVSNGCLFSINNISDFLWLLGGKDSYMLLLFHLSLRVEKSSASGIRDFHDFVPLEFLSKLYRASLVTKSVTVEPRFRYGRSARASLYCSLAKLRGWYRRVNDQSADFSF